MERRRRRRFHRETVRPPLLHCLPAFLGAKQAIDGSDVRMADEVNAGQGEQEGVQESFDRRHPARAADTRAEQQVFGLRVAVVARPLLGRPGRGRSALR